MVARTWDESRHVWRLSLKDGGEVKVFGAAKGVDEMALSIRDVAGKHRISIVEAPPLARALYRHAQIDREIPVTLYAAVAQVLSYVYQLKRWHPAHGPMPTLSEVPVDPALSEHSPDGSPTP